jgi:hypothetical protein
MTRKLLLGGMDLLAAGFRAGKNAVWYGSRRLHRA